MARVSHRKGGTTINTTDLLTKFARIGAMVKVADRPTRRSRVPLGAISLDIQADRQGEFFEVVSPGGTYPEVAVLDVQPADRHLLLMVREGGEKHRASAHFSVDGKDFTESGSNPRKALISGVGTRRLLGKAASIVLPERSPTRCKTLGFALFVENGLPKSFDAIT